MVCGLGCKWGESGVGSLHSRLLDDPTFVPGTINSDQLSEAQRLILGVHRVQQQKELCYQYGPYERSSCMEVSMNEHLLDPKFIMLAGVVILVIAVLAWLYVQKRRSTTTSLRQKFGLEYERAVHQQGSERKAEKKLADRQERVEKLNIRDLDPMERERFLKRWESVQSRFVDSPKGAVTEADDLVSSLMKTRGYPVSDFDQRAADISVDHPWVVENYRSAHEIALRVGKDATTTEDLRTAMIHYRSLFEELVQGPTVMEKKEVA
jgi:hypothetical protein